MPRSKKNHLQFSTGKMEDVLPEQPAESFTAAVFDPPYDTIASHTELAWNRTVTTESFRHIHRLLKPGAYCIAFGSPARHHRMMTNMEDAGFEIKDVFLWLFGDRMPRARDIGKRLDDPRWHDYHPHVKQAWEPIVIARKPTELSYHDNAEQHGVGGFNVGMTRIPLLPGEKKGGFLVPPKNGRKNMLKAYEYIPPVQGTGRYPSNVLMDEFFAEQLDDQTLTVSGGTNHQTNPHSYQFLKWAHRAVKPPQYGNMPGEAWKSADRVSLSRFFYCGKASPAERKTYNKHTCVKPLAVMRWLLSLVMYPGVNRILDPYVGSGGTPLAALSLQMEEPGLNLSGLFVDDDPGSIRVAKRRMRDMRKEVAVVK